MVFRGNQNYTIQSNKSTT